MRCTSGWYLQNNYRSPRNLHISVNYGTVPNVEALLADLRDLRRRSSSPLR
jgi:hypothetical protein